MAANAGKTVPDVWLNAIRVGGAEMIIGWLADPAPGYRGGAELAAEWLQVNAPRWATVIPMPPGNVTEADAYVVHNCVRYGMQYAPVLNGKPIVKHIHDLWPSGDYLFRAWLLEHATVTICSSPLHEERLRQRWAVHDPLVMVPPVSDLAPFRAMRNNPKRQFGAVWIGRLEYGKGYNAAVEYCRAHGLPLDVYGYGSEVNKLNAYARYCGPVAETAVPEILSRYETFIFLPAVCEPFGRAVAEAWAAGCKIVTNGNCGAAWWLKERPAALFTAAVDWWALVAAKLQITS